MAAKRCYADPPPGIDLEYLSGALIVIEGPDGSGRSTHIELLSYWLEQQGYPVARMGLTRSELVSQELEQAKLGNVMSHRTRSLFYASDFYDQLENVIVPAMRAGSVVLADRYIFTLMARDRARGADPSWLESLYSMALVPDVVFYFSVSEETLSERTLSAYRSLDYWESGMDLGLDRDWYASFQKYQRLLREEFEALRGRYGFEVVDANGSIESVQASLREAIAGALEGAYLAPTAPPVPKIPKAPPHMNLEVS
jgi:dTMP kinase